MMTKNVCKELLLVMATPLVFVGCGETADIQGGEQPSNGKNTIGFNIDMEQDWYAEKPATRAAMEQNSSRNIQMQSSDGKTVWLQSTTVMGINERPMAADTAAITRGTALTSTSQMSPFSDFCFTANDGATGYESFFENVSVGRDGRTPYLWPGEKTLRCIAIHPYDSNPDNFSVEDAGQHMVYDFTVNSDVASQVDLMYAISNDVAYNEAGQVPLTSCTL